MTASQIRDVLNTGKPIVDIGQMTPEGKAYLRKLVRKELVEVDWCRNFPTPKRAYYAFDTITEN